MKLAALFSVLIVAGIFFFFNESRIEPLPQLTIPKQVYPTVVLPKDRLEVRVNTKNYLVSSVEILQDSTLELVANFNQKKSGEKIVEERKCLSAINGGFYQENDRPLGLFYSDGSVSGKLLSNSNLVTGIFWQDREGKRFLGRNVPSIDDAAFILQTGPLMEVGEKKLKLVRDEQARRSLLGLSGDNKLYMISVFEKDNTFSGPLLSDIPVFFNSEEVKEKWNIHTLLNLDGGSASFFYNKEGEKPFMLSELSPIGSLLCVTKS